MDRPATLEKKAGRNHAGASSLDMYTIYTRTNTGNIKFPMSLKIDLVWGSKFIFLLPIPFFVVPREKAASRARVGRRVDRSQHTRRVDVSSIRERVGERAASLVLRLSFF